MTPSRHYFDPLKSTTEPRWLRVVDQARQVIETRELAPLCDLRAELDVERRRREAEGWAVEWPIGRYASGFFMSKDGRRWYVAIASCLEPRGHGGGWLRDAGS